MAESGSKMLNGSHSNGNAPKRWTPFRDNLLKALEDSDSLSDQEIREKLNKVLNADFEKVEFQHKHQVITIKVH